MKRPPARRSRTCDTPGMVPRWQSAWASLIGVASALPGCATQHDTAQALTIAGAAAVIVGASMAADEQCYNAGPGEGGIRAYCAPGLSKGARTAGKGLAVAGVGLAAAGYALKPKGPDRWQRSAPDPDSVPASPYRLVRPAPEQPEAPPLVEPSPAAPPGGGAAPPAACAPAGSPSVESRPASNCPPRPGGSGSEAPPSAPPARP